MYLAQRRSRARPVQRKAGPDALAGLVARARGGGRLSLVKRPVHHDLFGQRGSKILDPNNYIRTGIGDELGLPFFHDSVEYWRSLVEKYAGSIPVPFLLAWMQRESDGNPCSYTTMRESGLFQLMPPDNTDQGGTTEAALRAACVGSTQQTSRDLTDDEKNEQIRSGVQYVNVMRDRAHAKLRAAGLDWSESSPDFWRMVKLQHAYPGPTATWLTAATTKLGRPPATWDEFRSAINGYATVLDNAEWVGGYGIGGGTNTTALLALGGLALAGFLLWRSRRPATYS